MDAFARWLTRHPLAVVVANLGVTAVLGLYALHIRIENSLESMLPAGDPKVAYYNATRALFGSDDVGVIGVRADDVFAPSTLEKIARVPDALAKVPGVERGLSIPNAGDPRARVRPRGAALHGGRARESGGGRPHAPRHRALHADRPRSHAARPLVLFRNHARRLPARPRRHDGARLDARRDRARRQGAHL